MDYQHSRIQDLNSDDTFAISEGSIDQVGCIHTCQGLEFDYVGVIIGPDLLYRDGKVVTDHHARASTDQALRGLKKRYPDPLEAQKVADRIIRNTYRTLLSRGVKGCYVFCTDKELQRHIGEMIVAGHSRYQRAVLPPDTCSHMPS